MISLLLGSDKIGCRAKTAKTDYPATGPPNRQEKAQLPAPASPDSHVAWAVGQRTATAGALSTTLSRRELRTGGSEVLKRDILSV
jgi:hypothetical protein